MKTVGLAAAAADHESRVGAGRYANQDALVGAVELVNALAVKVGFELMIDHVGGQDQGDLAQLGKLAFDLGRVEDGTLSAFQGMAYAVFGGCVDQLDFIGGADEGFGNRVGY